MIGQWLLIALVLLPIHRVPERLELCVAVPVTILLHSDRAVRRGEPITAEASIEHQCGNSNLVSRSPHMGDCVGIRGHQSREQITAAAWMMRQGLGSAVCRVPGYVVAQP